MSALNTFVPFDASSETWESYIEGFDCFLEAKKLVDLSGSWRRVLFLNFCGKQMFDTARALLASQHLNAVTWEAPASEKKTLAVHQEEATEEDANLPGDDNIHRLKTVSEPRHNPALGVEVAIRKQFAGLKMQSVSAAEKGHLARKCRAILPDDRAQAKQGPSKGPPRKVP
ncbi:hypothetical protein E2320_000170, partial [Naja naja]